MINDKLQHASDEKHITFNRDSLIKYSLSLGNSMNEDELTIVFYNDERKPIKEIVSKQSDTDSTIYKYDAMGKIIEKAYWDSLPASITSYCYEPNSRSCKSFILYYNDQIVSKKLGEESVQLFDETGKLAHETICTYGSCPAIIGVITEEDRFNLERVVNKYFSAGKLIRVLVEFPAYMVFDYRYVYD